MNKQILWTVLVFSLVMLSLWNLSFMMGSNSGSRDLFDPLLDAYNIIQERFYRVDDVDRTELLQESLRGMIEALDDPYSNFLSAEDFERFNRGLEGEFVGVGIHIGIRDDRLTIVSPIKNSPADQAGARSGDVILLIDDTDTEGMGLDEAVSLLRGRQGTKVVLEVLHRDGSNGTLEITRDVIHVPTVETRFLDEGTIGYIRLFMFNENAAQDVEDALFEFKHANVEGIIFDLRGNGGGLLNQAIKISSQFIDSGVVLTTTGPTGTVARNSQGNIWDNLPLAVLIDDGSASASEIVAGAIQDTQMGVLVGQQSFGKGVVQSLFPLPDGSYIKLTTAEYLTPAGRHVQGEGLKPDLSVVDAAALVSEAINGLSDLKPSLYTREVHIKVNDLTLQLRALFDPIEADTLDAHLDAATLLRELQANRSLFLSASDDALSEALDTLEQTLTALVAALKQSPLTTALEWLHARVGQLCPCPLTEAVAQP